MGMFSDPAVQRLLVRCALILLGLALAVVGLWLARRARRRGRRGSAPHCFQCGYNLTGLPLPELNQRCPECGTDLSAPRAVARGRPTRHMPTLTVALLLTVIGGLTAADFAVSLWLRSSRRAGYCKTRAPAAGSLRRGQGIRWPDGSIGVA